MSPSKQPVPAAAALLRGVGSDVDKIRDILFGVQLRDYESRFSRLEESLLKETAELRESARRRLDQLENHVRTELESLRAQSQEESGAARRDSRHDGDPGIRAQCQEIAAIMADRVHELQSGKIDRAALAALFTEVALRLSDQFRVTGSNT